MAATKAKPYLQSLMTAALALPGISIGQTVLESKFVEYKHVSYDEDDLMHVDAEYLSFGLPLGDDDDLLIDVEYETMSGASPVFMTPDLSGSPVQVVSGASIADQRTAVSVRYRHWTANGSRIVVAPSTSDEDDYSSRAVTVEYQWDTANNNTSFAVGAGLAADQVASSVDPAIGGDKDGTSFFVGLTHVLNAKSLVQLNFSSANESGYLNDPYKLTMIQNIISFESRPEDLTKTTLFARYIRHTGENNSWHLSYRSYSDDWSIRSHMIESSWHLSRSRGWALIPTLRYYTQDRADFYAPYFLRTRSDGHYSSDYRLASFGSILAGLAIEKSIGNHIKLNLDAEAYRRDGELKLSGVYSVDPSPLTSYAVVFGLNYTF